MRDENASQRSSLQVNLSFVSNVTDSGHYSYRNTDNVTCTGNSSGLQLTRKRIHAGPTSTSTSRKIVRQLPKIISIKSNFNNKDQALNESCSIIREAILRKTREIFDQCNEVAIKTNEVLEKGSKLIQSVESHCTGLNFTENDGNSKRESIPTNSQGPVNQSQSLKPMILEMSTNTRSTFLRKIEDENLIKRTSSCDYKSPPKNLELNKSRKTFGFPSERIALREDQQLTISEMDRNLDPVQLNLMKSPLSRWISNSQELTTPKSSQHPSVLHNLPKKRLFHDENSPDNIYPDPKNVHLENLLDSTKLSSESRSPILSGSARKRTRNIKKKVQTQVDQQNNPSTMKEGVDRFDRGTSPRFPLIRSSFKDDGGEKRRPGFPSPPEDRNESSCMEITAISNVLPISERYRKPIDGGNPRNDESLEIRQDKRVSSMEFTGVGGPLLDSSNSFSLKGQKQKARRTSLHVHTSLNPIDTPCEKIVGCKNQKTPCMTPCSLKTNSFLGSSPKISKTLRVLEYSGEAARIRSEGETNESKENRIRNSLGSKKILNPDLISDIKIISDSDKSEYSIEPKNTSRQNNFPDKSLSEYLESLSLMERLRRLFQEPSMSGEELRNSRNTRTSIKNESGELSCIKGTPLPISRTFLWKSQMKQNISSSGLNSGVSNKESKQRECKKSIKNWRHPALDNIGTLPPEKSVEKIADESDEDFVSRTMRKTSKRKLYVLGNRSQLLSLSPARSVTPSPKRIVFPRRRKKKQSLELRSTQRVERVESTKYMGNSRNFSSLSDTNIDNSDNELPTRLKVEPKKPRKVLPKKIIIRKFANPTFALASNSYDEKEFQKIRTRNSADDFEKRKEMENRRRNIPKRVIVITGFSNEDKNFVKNVVKKLGKAQLEKNVTKKTTHVISTGVRTINLLKGIIRGAWLVKLDWVLDSLSRSEWLSPGVYELEHFSTAVKENRRGRQIFGNTFVPDIFATCGLIYVQNSTAPSSSTLKELIKSAGGQVTGDPQTARIIVGSEGLKEIWVLDSITTGKLQNPDHYRRE